MKKIKVSWMDAVKSVFTGFTNITGSNMINHVTGTGTSIDNDIHGIFVHNFQSIQQQQAMMTSVPMAFKMITLSAKDATRFLPQIIIEDDDEGEMAKKITELLEEMEVKSVVRLALIDSRAYGMGYIEKDYSGIVVRGYNHIDSSDTTAVINAKANNKKVKKDPLGMLSGYNLILGSASQQIFIPIHKIIHIKGEHLPRSLFVTNHYKYNSLLNISYSDVRRYESAKNNMSTLVHRSNIETIGIKNLRKAHSDEEGQSVNQQIIAVAEARSNHRIMYHDSEATIGTLTTDIGSSGTVIDAFADAMVAASDLPISKLTGRQSKGFSTDESDMAKYATTVQTLQIEKLEPVYREIIEDLIMSEFETVVDFKIIFDVLNESSADAQFESKKQKFNHVTTALTTLAPLMKEGIINIDETAKALNDMAQDSGIHIDMEKLMKVDKIEDSENAIQK